MLCRFRAHYPQHGLFSLPRRSAHRYTQMLETRHFGMDAEIQRPWKAGFRLLHCLNEALIQLSNYHPYRPCCDEGFAMI